MNTWKKVLLGAGSAVISAQTAGAAEGQAGRPPNFIILLADDLGRGDVGAYGCPDIPTPNVDKLAAQGVRCMNAYTLCPICAPSRTAIITGRYPQRDACNGLIDRGTPISDTHPTIAEFMRDAGYVTGMVGRWDIGAPVQGPLNKGFMEVARRSTLPANDPRRVASPGGPTYLQEDGVYYTDRNRENLVEFVERHKDVPFFLYFAPLAIHSPVQEVPQNYLDRVPASITDPARRCLAATLIALDDAIGALMSAVNRLGLDEKTVVVFTSDNGGQALDGARNAPFRGGKATEWEGGLRMPFIFRWTGKVPAGQTFNGILSTLDVYATAAAVAGKQPPVACDGINLLPYMTGQSKGDVHEELYFRWLEGKARGQHAIRRGKWRLIKQFQKDPWQLYDIEADPGETANLAAQHPEVVQDLAGRFEKWVPTIRDSPGTKPGAGGSTPVGIGWATSQNP
jgi:arylsulfatase A-like enzyme